MLRCGDTLQWFWEAKIPGFSKAISRLIKNLLASVFVAHFNSCLFWAFEVHVEDMGRWIQHHLLDSEGNPTDFTHRYARNLYVHHSFFSMF
jgi:hypothetical protein